MLSSCRHGRFLSRLHQRRLALPVQPFGFSHFSSARFSTETKEDPGFHEEIALEEAKEEKQGFLQGSLVPPLIAPPCYWSFPLVLD